MSSLRAITLIRMSCFAGLMSLAALTHGADSSAAKSASPTTLLEKMAGSWDVQSRMWPGPNAKAIDLPDAIARRDLVAGTYLSERMSPLKPSAQDRFERVAYFNYNTVNRQYEYFSLDSRLPQMMSYAVPGANKMHAEKVELQGTSFVAPEWGQDRNVPFMYRLTIGPVEAGQQVLQLFLTKQGTQSGEFLAFEYVYRQRSSSVPAPSTPR